MFFNKDKRSIDYSFTFRNDIASSFKFLLFIACLSSCSAQKKISREANKIVLSSKPLSAAHVGISIFEPATNKTWYDYQGAKYFVPASNTKIPTCYVAMKYLGDSLVGIRYSVEPDSSIVIQPTADPTFLASEYKRQPVFDHIKKFKKIILKTEIYQDYLGSGWSWNDYQEEYMAQRSDLPMYGNVARFTLDNNEVKASPRYFDQFLISIEEGLESGFDIEKPWEENQFFVAPGRNKTLEVPFNATFQTIRDLLQDTLDVDVEVDPFINIEPALLHSQPTDSMLKPMMHRSDNFYAEQSLLMVSNERLGIMDDSKIIDTILKTDFADLPQRPRWVDGSGLSRYNLFTPQSMVSILNKMKNEFGMERIKEIFPTGGRGTITSYYKADSGYIYAKTGTLSGVVALSGFLYTKKNKLLVFSILVNNHQSSATEIRKTVERFLTGIRKNF